MKTTVDVSDPILREAKKLAASEGTTLRALVERGLRHVIAEKASIPRRPFKLRTVTFPGTGLQPDFQDVGWDKIRDATYGDPEA